MLENDDLVDLIPVHRDVLADMFRDHPLLFHQFLPHKTKLALKTCLFRSSACSFIFEIDRIALFSSFLFFANRFRSSKKSEANHFISAIT